MRDACGLVQFLKRAMHCSAPSVQAPSSVTRLLRAQNATVASLAPTESATPLPSHWFRSAAVLDVRGLKISTAGPATAPLVDQISLSITRGEVIGLVGDASSGASAVAQGIAGVLPAPAVIESGSILFNGLELVGLPRRTSSPVPDAKIAYLPCDPIASLDQTLTVGAQLAAPLRSRLGLSKPAAYRRSLELLRRAGVENPLHTFAAYPRNISASLAQRVHIAHAIAQNPELLVANRPTDALNETDSTEILDLLRKVQGELDVTMIIVTQSVSVAALICHRVAVVRNGVIVEYASVADLFDSPKHPYTRELLDAEENERACGQAL